MEGRLGSKVVANTGLLILIFGCFRARAAFVRTFAAFLRAESMLSSLYPLFIKSTFSSLNLRSLVSSSEQVLTILNPKDIVIYSVVDIG